MWGRHNDEADIIIYLFRDQVKQASCSELFGAQMWVGVSGSVYSEAGSVLATAWRLRPAVNGGLERPSMT